MISSSSSHPKIGISKQTEDYSFALGGAAEIARYADFSSQNYADAVINGEGRLRLVDDIFVFGGGDYAWEHEPRSSPNDIGAAEPTPYRDGSGFFGTSGRFDDVAVRLGANLQVLDFDNVPAIGGGTINNQDRDRTQGEFGGRLGYFVQPGTQVFFQGIYDTRTYDDPVDDNGYERDSTGFEAALGLSGSWKTLSGEVLVGALLQDYEDPRFETVVTPDLGAEVTWRPGPGTRLIGTVERTIEETTLAGSSSYVSTVGGARMVRRLAPDVSLITYAYLTQEDFQEIGRIDYITDLGADLRYYLTPHAFTGISYGFESRNSTAPGADYDTQTIMVNVGADLDPAFGPGDPVTGLSPTGFYVGGFGADGALQTTVAGVRSGGAGGLVADFGGFGQAIGLFGGYRADFGGLELGVEIEGELGNADWEHAADRAFSVSRNNSFGVGMMIGRETRNGVLLYGRGGIAVTEFETSYSLRGSTTEISDYELGPRLALGAEFPIGNGVSGRLEYAYTNYDDYLIGAQTGGSADDFANSEAMARFGVVYEFGATKDQEITPADFSGPYAGLQVGHGTLVTENLGFRPNDAAPDFPLDVTRSGQGLTGGAFAGYGKAFDGIYLGIEAEAEISNANWNIERAPDRRIYSVEKKGSVGGSVRAGYVLNESVLVYLRGGVVGTAFDTDYSTALGSVADNEFLVGTSIRRRRRVRARRALSDAPRLHADGVPGLFCHDAIGHGQLRQQREPVQGGLRLPLLGARSCVASTAHLLCEKVTDA